MPKLVPVMALVLLSPALAPQDNPLSAHARTMYTGLKNILIRSAERMPEEHYAFKPVDAVRSYGQIIGHIADWQYHYCSAVLGDRNPAPRIEQTRTSKADLVAALKDALAYCDRAFSAMTDAAASAIADFHGMKMPRLGILTIDLVHSTEHYGNLVTYMRLKDIVPPTSEPGFEPVPKKWWNCRR